MQINKNANHYNVYVIELERTVEKNKRFKEANSHEYNNIPVYVGMTGLPVEKRFQNHMKGYKSSRYVCKFGIRLMPELYQHLKAMSYEAACAMEKALANDLRKRGYSVWQR